MIKNVGVIGYGLIGSAIVRMLEDLAQLTVTAYDIRPSRFALKIDGTQEDYDAIAKSNDAVVVATPFTENRKIIDACVKHGTAYFDMTEDVNVTAYAQAAAERVGGWFMPQCGLAPGAVSIIAKHLLDELGDVTNPSIEIRVGALPRSANNAIKYYLTWSSEGLVNEYCNPCHAIVEGKSVDLQPLQGVEHLTIDGTAYEAFNTSGGLGTLRETLGSQMYNLNYKTMRYPGHRDYFNFLLFELGLNKKMPVLVDILNSAVPHVHDDVVVITIKATGTDARGWVQAKQYTKKVYATEDMTAIQITTAAGLCAAVHWWYWEGDKPHHTGLRHSEDMPWSFFKTSQFSKPYLNDN